MQVGEPTRPELQGRRRRRHAAPISLRRSVYDGFAMALLLAAVLLGPVLFGAVRMWSFGPLMILTFLGVALFCLRPFLAADLRRVQVPPGGLAWILFLVYGLCLMPRAAVPYEARMELLRLASWIGAYWAWSELASRHGRWRVLLGLVFFAVTLIAWYAVIQHCRGSRLVLNLERPPGYFMRASGTYFCPNHFAALLEIVIPFALALLFTGSAGVPLRLLAGYSLILLLPVMFLTQSRSGWIGTAAGVVVTALLLAARRSRKLLLVLALLLPLVLAAAAGILWTVSPMVRERVVGASLGAPDSAVRARLETWEDTVRMIRDRPWTGFGPGSFQWVFPSYKTRGGQMLYNYTHNEYLQLLAENGVIGLALIAALVLGVVVRLLRRIGTVARDKDAGLIAGLLGSLAAVLAHAVFDFNLHLFSNNHILVLLAGVVVASLYASEELKPRPTPAPWGLAAWGAGALVALLLALAVVQSLLGYGFHLLGERARAAFRMNEALRLHRRAARVDPGNWRGYLGLAHVYQMQSFWNLDPAVRREQAQASLPLYEKARALNPYDLDVPFGMSKARNVLGEPEKALTLLEEIVRRDPTHRFYVIQLGLQLQRMGRYEDALRVFEKADPLGNDEAVRLNLRRLRKRLAPPPRAAATPL